MTGPVFDLKLFEVASLDETGTRKTEPRSGCSLIFEEHGTV